MVLDLTVFERALLLAIFPHQTGDIMAIRAIRKFREECSLTPEEIEEYEVSVDDKGQMKWNNRKAQNKKIEVADFVREKVAVILHKLSDENRLGEEHFSLFEKIIGEQ